LQVAPEDFFTDIVLQENFLAKNLKIFFELLNDSKIDQKIM